MRVDWTDSLVSHESKYTITNFAGTSHCTSSVLLVHTVQLKPMIKPQISGRMDSSGISDVVFASVHSEKTRLKKLMKMMIIFTS